MKQKIQRVGITTLLIGLILALLVAFTMWWNTQTPRTPKKKWHAQTHEQWMTVFVHGSFGSVLGLLSVMDVIQDKVDKTNYKKMTSHMRHNPYFYQMQPLQEPGLKPVHPTFDVSTQQKKRYAVPTVAAAYDELTEQITPRKEKNLYYTFGWSGLISQDRRRRESVRFYNMLNEELEKLKERGITPKVRLIAHSHGGNVALNLAAVQQVLEHGVNTALEQTITMSEDHMASLQAMQNHLQSLGSRESAAHKDHQKKWDYVPESNNLHIDELVTLGTPIQPETDHYFISTLFDRAVNIYSDNDVVQKMDWVSTRRYYSDKRVSVEAKDAQENGLTQVRIMINRDMEKEETEDKTQNQPSWLNWIAGKKRNSTDPNHKELWFMSWRSPEKEASQAQEHIKPFPFAILIPCMRSLWEQLDTERDIDVNIVFEDEFIRLSAYEHGKSETLKSIHIPRGMLKKLQERAALWKPENLNATKEMDILQQYSSQMGA